MGRNQFILVVALCAGLFSCKKDEIEIPESNDPVFTTEGSFNGEAFSLIAGDNDAYMYTMTQTEHGVEIYSGIISDGDMRIELGIYDGNLDIPTDVFQNALATNALGFSTYVDTPLVVLSRDILNQFSGNQTIEQVNWFIDGVWKSEDTLVIMQPGRYMVRAVVDFYDPGVPNLITEDYVNELIIGYRNNGNFAIDLGATQPGYFSAGITDLTSDAGSGTAQSIEWLMNGSPISSSTFIQDSLPDGMNELEAKVTFDVTGAVRTKKALIGWPAGVASVPFVAPDLTVFEDIAKLNQPCQNRDFNVRLRIHKNGIDYSSEYAANQSGSSSINITGIEYYGKNSAGKDVYKVTADIAAFVAEAPYSNPIPVSFHTVFGFEIP